MVLFCFDKINGCGAKQEEHPGHKEHCGLGADEAYHQAARCGGDNLGQADGAVEKAQVASHIGTSLQGVGKQREGQGQHCGPGCADKEIGCAGQIFVVDECHCDKALSDNPERRRAFRRIEAGFSGAAAVRGYR